MNYYWVVQSNYNPKFLDGWFLGMDDDTCSHLVVESPELIIDVFQPFPACRAQGSQLHPTRNHGPGRSSKPGFSHVFCPKISGVVIMFPIMKIGLGLHPIFGQPQKVLCQDENHHQIASSTDRGFCPWLPQRMITSSNAERKAVELKCNIPKYYTFTYTYI